MTSSPFKTDCTFPKTVTYEVTSLNSTMTLPSLVIRVITKPSNLSHGITIGLVLAVMFVSTFLPVPHVSAPNPAVLYYMLLYTLTTFPRAPGTLFRSILSVPYLPPMGLIPSVSSSIVSPSRCMLSLLSPRSPPRTWLASSAIMFFVSMAFPARSSTIAVPSSNLIS